MSILGHLRWLLFSSMRPGRAWSPDAQKRDRPNRELGDVFPTLKIMGSTQSLVKSQSFPAIQGPMILRAGVFCSCFCWLLLGVWDIGLWQNRRGEKVSSKGIYLYTWPLLPGSSMWSGKNGDLPPRYKCWFLLAEKIQFERLVMVAAGKNFWGGIIVLGSIGRC